VIPVVVGSNPISHPIFQFRRCAASRRYIHLRWWRCKPHRDDPDSGRASVPVRVRCR